VQRRHLLILALGAPLLFTVGPPQAGALDGKAIVQSQCVSCHDIAGPAPKTFEALMKRRAPDLFYAGSKFNRPWLVKWVQNPTIIRQTGMMFLNNLVNADGKDRIKSNNVKPCPTKLKPDEAEAVADYLMTFKDAKMKTGVIDASKSFSQSRAIIMFTKQYPCIGCHTIQARGKETGGVSGPKLIGAGERLNPDWIYARIENPQYWDPKTWMPKIPLSDKKREMLTLFIASMK
jgi:mono/diheme cytochrome c family protein